MISVDRLVNLMPRYHDWDLFAKESNAWIPGSLRGKKTTLVDVKQDTIRCGPSLDLRETVLKGGFDLS